MIFLPHSLSRTWNLLRAELSIALSRCGIVRVVHMPTFVSVEPANVCQLRCPECPIGNGSGVKHGSTLMSMPVFERVLNQVASYAHTMQFYFQGEPLLNPELPHMIARAHAEGLYTIVSTNAQALTEQLAEQLSAAGLNRLIVSIDGFTQQSYEAYRVGGSLERALAGLRAAQGKRMQVVLQVLRLRTNEHEWDWVKQHYRQLGADRLEFKTAQLYNYEHGHVLMPTDTRYSRYQKGKDGTYQIKRRTILPQRGDRGGLCRRLWLGCVITTDGTVLPCCYDKSAQHAYGNLMQQPLAALFHSAAAQRFRLTVLKHRDSISICQNCNQ